MDAEFFKANRARLIEKLRGGSVILTAYTSLQRSGDAAFDFEQEANFWWLSGIDKPDWWLIIDGTRGRSILVAPEISETHAIFDGSLGLESAQQISGADAVVTHHEGETILQAMSRTHSLVYTLGDEPYAEFYNFALNPAPKKMHELLDRTFASVHDCRKELAKLRAIKQPAEIKAMRQAIAVTCKAFEDVKNQFQTFSYEYQIEAEFSYRFRRAGATGHAYDPIVGAGKNACTLHYSDNTMRLKKRELVLMDIGARVGGYAADITRTYAYGEPTKRQIAVHAAVQRAQQKIIDLLEPGLPLQDYLHSVDTIMKDALVALGLIKNQDDQEGYRRYFPHAISHGLGVDVHDSLGAPRFLEPGMVLTVEPGIYIEDEAIGVRLEDDILITAKGHENLSRGLSTDLR